ncbi:gliding motility-associated C-terminal domain-containing protein [Lewinella sp. IMCC34183]|uniref:T9SS type B sorting domain-containing protein n=1 Tax=Lewinella sp. IMCC34183 TaxID=2248762 RepID=UPI00130093C2|nr:gliding motility-associated C-terminal domain-containing protein [Lewinella sp. IMCC34183]
MRLFLLPLLLLAAALPAQVAAPDFLCTRSEAGDEVLTWSNVANDCGTFQGTEVYRAESAAGPYTLLTTLTDPAATEYRDPNPNGSQLFYYLQYAYDCPGEAVLTSDTLDSFIPVSPDLRFVSVVDGNLEVHWRPSPSPEVNRYVILEVTDTAVVPLDTVGLDTVYTVTGVPEAELTRRSYRVAALDACDNDSPQSDILSAVDLIGSGGSGCESDITLIPLEGILTTITLFVPDSGEVLSLYASTNGGDYVLSDTWTEASTVDSIVNGYTYSAANDGDSICFYFEMEYPGLDIRQRTLTYCQTVDIEQPVRDFSLYGVEVQDDGLLYFAYAYSSPPPVAYTADLEQVSGGDTVVYVDELVGFLSLNELTSLGAPPVVPGDSFRFVLTDGCERNAFSNYVSPVFLFADASGGGAQVQWTPLENGLPGTLTYNLYRVTADSTLELLAGNLDTLTYLDDDPNAGSVRCYRVEAIFQPEGSAESYSFLSNVACVAEETGVYIPNAFSPSATRDENRVFRPIFTVAAGIRNYRLQVFDRWGGLQFTTEDPVAGWDGRLNGRLAPAGAYVYVITFTSTQGNLVEYSGVVNVLY